MVNNNGRMDPSMKVSGKMTRLVVRENLSTQMGTSMKENGKMTRLTDTDNTYTTTELNILAIGRTINNMVKGKKVGQMELIMKDSMRKVRNMDKESLILLTDLHTMGNSIIMIFMERVNLD